MKPKELALMTETLLRMTPEEQSRVFVDMVILKQRKIKEMADKIQRQLNSTDNDIARKSDELKRDKAKRKSLAHQLRILTIPPLKKTSRRKMNVWKEIHPDPSQRIDILRNMLVWTCQQRKNAITNSIDAQLDLRMAGLLPPLELVEGGKLFSPKAYQKNLASYLSMVTKKRPDTFEILSDVFMYRLTPAAMKEKIPLPIARWKDAAIKHFAAKREETTQYKGG